MSQSKEPEALGYVGRKPTAKVNRNDWHTPEEWLKLVRDTLGWIELDPFSSEAANRKVQASRYWDPSINAFEQKDWNSSRVFMNPPYGALIFRKAIHAFLRQYLAGRIGAAILLTNNVTETFSGQLLLGHCDMVLFPKGRISFEATDGKIVSNNTRGQMLTLFAKDHLPIQRLFYKNFAPRGIVLCGTAQKSMEEIPDD